MNEQTWTDTELVELARQHKYEVTAAGALEKANVLPCPVQDAHASKGTWSSYPPGTNAYLLAACRLRTEGKEAVVVTSLRALVGRVRDSARQGARVARSAGGRSMPS